MTEFYEYSPADGAWSATDDALVSAPFDYAVATAGFTPTAGTLYLTRIHVRGATTITNLLTQYFTAAATPAGTYLALYDTAGVQLGVTADASTAFSTTVGLKSAALTTAYAVTKATDLFVGFLINSAGTVPHLAIAGTVGVNGARTGYSSRFATGPAGNTTLAPAATFTVPTALANAIWAGVS